MASFSYGAPGWTPVVGDWDGNGTATVGVVDPSTMTWYLRNSNTAGAPNIAPFQFGAPGWIPVVGDWDGNGTTTIGVVDPSTMTWYLRNSNTPGAPSIAPFQFGAPGWIPVVGDWDGNGTTTIGVVDPSTMTWYLRNSHTPGAPDIAPFQYGVPGWTPVVGDWANNGITSAGVVDPTSGTWYVRNENKSGPPDITPFSYGVPGWTPLSVTPTGPPIPASIDAAFAAGANIVDSNGDSVKVLLGLPTSILQSIPGIPGGNIQSFQGGTIYYSPSTGAHALTGSILAEYAATANETAPSGASVQSILGLPTSDEQSVSGIPGASYVNFQGGTIYYSPATGAHVIYGSVATVYANQGGPTGSLGLPTSDEQPWAGGYLVQFQSGQISVSPTTGAVVLIGTWQAVDGSGNPVTYVLENGYLCLVSGNDLKPISGILGVSQVSLDGAKHLYALTYSNELFKVLGATVKNEGSATKMEVDNLGDIVLLDGQYGFSYITPGGLDIGGGGITSNGGQEQNALDAQGRLYSLLGGILTVTNNVDSSPSQVATGVTQVEVDSAGELVMLLGSSQYQYFLSGGLAIGGSAISSSGQPVQYALDASGRLYTLLGGVLTVADTSSSTPQQAATGVTKMAVDSQGEVIILQGVNAFQILGGTIGSTSASAGPNPLALTQYALDSQGRLFTLDPSNKGAVTVAGSTNPVGYGIQLASTSAGVVVFRNSSGYVYQVNNDNSLTLIGEEGVTAADYSGWYLGLYTVDSNGNYPIYRMSNGQITLLPGAATSLTLSSNGTVSLKTNGGGVPIVTPNGTIVSLPNVTNETNYGNGSYAVSFGPWLSATVTPSVNAAQATLSFTNVTLTVGPLLNLINGYVSQLQDLTEPLAALTTPLTQVPGISQILSRTGTQSNLDFAGLLAQVLGTIGHPAEANAINTLDSLVKAINGIPYFGNTGTVSLPNFTASVNTSSVLTPINLPGGDLFQQLGGAYANISNELRNALGITIPSEAQLIGILLGGNSNIPLITYTLPTINVNDPVINQPLVTILAPIPVVSVTGGFQANLNFTVGGAFSLLASGLTTGDLGQAFRSSVTFSAGVSFGPYGEIDLGIPGATVVGYHIAGLLDLGLTAQFTNDGFTTKPTYTDTVQCNWVGPTLNASALGSFTVDAINMYTLVYNLEIEGADYVLKQWGLPTIPTIPSGQTIVNGAVSSVQNFVNDPVGTVSSTISTDFGGGGGIFGQS